jgi:hypothetical protein
MLPYELELPRKLLLSSSCLMYCRAVMAAQGRLLVDHVLQLLVVVYSLSGDRLPPAPPLYSADEVDLREALADVVMAHARSAEQQQQQQRQDWSHTLCMECLPQVQHLLQQVSGRSSQGGDATLLKDRCHVQQSQAANEPTQWCASAYLVGHWSVYVCVCAHCEAVTRGKRYASGTDRWVLRELQLMQTFC